MASDADDTRPSTGRRDEAPFSSARDTAAMPAMVGRGSEIGRYLVVQRLGQGGMGVVYAAYDAELDRRVAIKLLKPRRAGDGTGHARLLREAQAMARVSHPNVIAVHDVGTYGDQVFVAMDLVDGTTLSGWMKLQARSWQEIARAYHEAGRGLHAVHSAGLVHRDFKPQNVLVGRDGRVFVTDFGLARPEDSNPDAETDRSSGGGSGPPLAPRASINADVTADGVVLGTPKYMAPEQHLGGPLDARADQFSFCAALYAALWKHHPFDPERLAKHADLARAPQTSPSLANRRASGPPLIAEPPSEPRVPQRLKRAVMRGLQLRPESRFESMEPLLTEISEALHPRSTRVAASAAALAAVLLLVGGAWAYRERSRAGLCTGGAAEVAASWNPSLAAAVGNAFAAAAPDRGPDLSRRVLPVLDAYAGQWAAEHREACQATRLRGEQTEPILALRMRCLERRRKELGALVDVLQRADGALVDRSLDAALGLPSVRQCRDADALAQVAGPDDPARLASIRAVEEHLAKVDALRAAGKYPDGLNEARKALEAARALSFRPLEAEARYAVGMLLDLTGDQRGGARELREALLLAEGNRDEVTKLRAAIRLGYVVGYRELRFDDGVGWERLGEATLQRLGRENYPDLEGSLLTGLGLIQLRAGEYRDAAATFERALALADKDPSQSEAARARALANIAVARGRMGDREAAVSSGKAAIASFEKLRGADHPSLVTVLYNLAESLRELGRFEEANQAADRALDLSERKLGASHATTADVLDTRAALRLDQGRTAEALADAERALEIKKKTAGADSPILGFTLDVIGRSQLALGRTADAAASLERALQLKPPDDTVMADIRFGLARALWAAPKQRARALSLCSEARLAFEKLGYARRVAEVDGWLAAATRRRSPG